MILLGCAASQASAQKSVSREMIEEVETSPVENDMKVSSDRVLIPIPISDPSLATGLGVVALRLFAFGGAARPSLIGAGVASFGSTEQ